MINAISEDQIKSFMSAVFANRHDNSSCHSWDFTVALHGSNNSAIADIDASATAYAHRDKLLIYQFADRVTHGRYLKDGLGVLERFRESITHSLKGEDWGMYANYVDTQLDGETAQKLYWGDNLRRLRRIKKKLDPDQVFWNPHSIRPLS